MKYADHHYYVYFMTNNFGYVIYLGVTNNLERRISEHKQGTYKGFSKKYCMQKLVYYEDYQFIQDAILREKEIKKWRREKKNKLVETLNPDWRDLSLDWDFSDRPNEIRAPSK